MTTWTHINPADGVLSTAIVPGSLSVQDYGARGDGTTDDSTAINLALAAIASRGGTLVFPPGTYLCQSQLVLTKTGNYPRACIYGYGAEITTSGAISGLRLERGITWAGISVHGLTINHRGNANATYGFELARTWDCKLYDCTVIGHGTQSSYAAYICRNSDPADPDTGCFWTSFINCKTRRQGSGDGTRMARGIKLQGAANATNILSCNLGDVTTSIEIKPELGQTYAPNGVAIMGCHLESYVTAIVADNLEAGTAGPVGLRIINNRFENGTTLFDWCATSTTQPAVPPYLAGNHMVSNAGTYIVNPNSIYYNSLDINITPSVNPAIKADLLIEGKAGSSWPLTLKPVGGSRGLLITESGGAQAGQFTWTGTGAEVELRSEAASDLYISGVQGISNTLTRAQNLRGSKTFDTSAAAAVTFSVAETNTSYFIALSGSANETFFVTNKGTGGFTLNSSNANSTATVDWHLIR